MTIWTTLPVPACTDLSESAALTLGPISAALEEFYNYYPSAPHDSPIYDPAPLTTPPDLFAEALFYPGFKTVAPLSAPDPRFTTATPLTPPNPQMVFLDGLSSNLLQYDLTTQQITSAVVVPSTTGPLGIRPLPTGTAHEVWTANAGSQVTVSDLTSQSVVTNIATPSIPQSAVPAGIVFTPDGTTAFEAVGYLSADSAGNNGALVVFDAVNGGVKLYLPAQVRPHSGSDCAGWTHCLLTRR